MTAISNPIWSSQAKRLLKVPPEVTMLGTGNLPADF